MRNLFLGAGLALLGSAGVWAAEPETIDPITIEALPLADTEAEALQPVSVLADEALLRERDTSLGRTLAGEPGISSADFGAGVGRPVIRGLSGARVRVQENGLSSADVSTLSVDHAVTLDPAGARRIEVLKGPATLLYGSGAIGGVVNAVTDRVPRAAPTRLTGSADLMLGDDTDDARHARLEATGGAGPLAWNLLGGHARSDDYFADDNRRIDNSFAETDTYSGGLSWTGGRGYLGAAVSGFDRDYGIPAEDAAIAMTQDRLDVAGELMDPMAGFERLSVAAAYTDYLHSEGGEAFFDNEESELRLELVHGPAAGWRGALGLQATDRDFRAYGEEESFVPATDTRAVGLFAVEERPLGAWTLQLGGRIERQAHEVEDGRPDRDHTPVSLAAGLRRPLGSTHLVTASVGRYQRAPAAEELYSFGPHEATQTFERGDDDLDEETARGLDLGLRRTEGRLRWSLAAFYTDYADFLYLDGVDAGLDADGGGSGSSDGAADRVDEDGAFEPDGELLLVDYRAGDARFYGGEAELSYDLLTDAPRLTLRLLGDIVRGELDGGADLPRITPARYGAALDLTTGPWLATLTARRTTEQSRVAPLEATTDGFTELSAFLAYALPGPGAEATVYLRGENLLDEELVRHASFLRVPQPGRRLIAGLRVAF